MLGPTSHSPSSLLQIETGIWRWCTHFLQDPASWLHTSQVWLHIINCVRRKWSTTGVHRNQTTLPAWRAGCEKHLPWWWEHSTLGYRGSAASTSAASKVPGSVARTGSRDPNLCSIWAVLWLAMAFKHLPLPTIPLMHYWDKIKGVMQTTLAKLELQSQTSHLSAADGKMRCKLHHTQEEWWIVLGQGK